MSDDFEWGMLQRMVTQSIAIATVASSIHREDCGSGGWGWGSCPRRAQHVWSGHRVYARVVEQTEEFIDQLVALAVTPGDSLESVELLRQQMWELARDG